MSEIEDEIRASLVADLSLSHIFYHEAEDSADSALKRLKDQWAHELAEEIRLEAQRYGANDWSNGFRSAATMIDPHSREENPCPYTHAHTRHWCGYEQCRDS